MSSNHETKKSRLGSLGMEPTASNRADVFIDHVLHSPGVEIHDAKKLVLYQSTNSPFCWQIRQMMNRKNLEYETLTVTPKSELVQEIEKHVGEFSAPILQHGNQWINDFEKIISYLDEHFPDQSKSTLAENLMGRLFSSKSILKKIASKEK